MCCFVQETHSDSSNEMDWRREWPGQVFLSHKQSNSAGVGILFSRAFSPQSVELHHVLPGHALMVKALYEKAQGALVRSRFMNASMLDSPSKFLFQPGEKERPEEGHPLSAIGQWVFAH
ncbi:hypothetical protein L3Q82_000911 [Scortum barcoo]|uniref:Uncharacterized protein n=1 Tax=Scortum barcoo TaxID=214431 RepID=A0ACB8WBF2_9TELE|nr:hypothetical protein L3Q82_000911 [Scortum barcoo]